MSTERQFGEHLSPQQIHSKVGVELSDLLTIGGQQDIDDEFPKSMLILTI